VGLNLQRPRDRLLTQANLTPQLELRNTMAGAQRCTETRVRAQLLLRALAHLVTALGRLQASTCRRRSHDAHDEQGLLPAMIWDSPGSASSTKVLLALAVHVVALPSRP
jgi:hypothetical protein